MAPVNKSDLQANSGKTCSSCSKATKSEIVCVVCERAYHASCAVRITGMKVTGYNELCCPTCSLPDNGGEDTTTNARQQYDGGLIKTNETLNAVILRLMADQESLKNQLHEFGDKLCQLTINCSRKSSRQNSDIEAFEVATIASMKPVLNPNSAETQKSELAENSPATRACEWKNSGVALKTLIESDSEHQRQVGCQRQLHPVGEKSRIPSGSRRQNGESKNGKIPTKYIQPKDAYAAIQEAVTESKLQRVIALGEEDRNAKNARYGEWKTVEKRHSRRQTAYNSNAPQDRKGWGGIIGTSKDASKIKAVPKTASIYVTRLTPETSAQDVKELLDAQFHEVKVEEKSSRFPEIYKSFKVTLNEGSLSAVLSPDVWPEGVRVSKFFQWKTPKTKSP